MFVLTNDQLFMKVLIFIFAKNSQKRLTFSKIHTINNRKIEPETLNMFTFSKIHTVNKVEEEFDKLKRFTNDYEKISNFK